MDKSMSRVLLAAVASASLMAVAACGGGESDKGNADLPKLEGQKIEVAAVWTGAEQKVFGEVIKGFEDETGAKVSFTSTGDDIATVLNTKLKGGAAPDIAILPQPGLLNQYAKNGDIQPLGADAVKAVEENYAAIWKDLGSYEDTPYGVWLDAANKSTVWYNASLFEQAGVSEPKTWDDFLKTAQTLNDFGLKAPVSLGGADGWTLTDWFENMYVRVAGADKYDQLSTHEIAWTDDSVVETLEQMKKLFADKALVGESGAALQTDFPTSVSNVFKADAGSAIVYEGSFVAGVIADASDFTVGEDAKWFPFPAVGDSPESVIGGGDVAVAFGKNKTAEAFLAYLATPEAAEKMVSTGSFTSANKNLDASAYPNENSKAVGQAIVDAGDNFRFDMSDLAPAAFGATVGSGEWKILQDFLKDPSDPKATAAALEKSAAKAYK